MRPLAAALTLALAAAPAVAAARQPVVVELFTSQGCSSCLRADRLAGELAERDDLLVLTLPVDYWDYLGWNDTFARPEFAQRQRAYLRRMQLRELPTPQIVVDGVAQAPGSDRERIEALLRRAEASPPNAPDMMFTGDGKVAVGSGPAPDGGADVWLVRYDPRARGVSVTAGENRGKTVVQRNVVRELRRLGDWRGRPSLYRIPRGGGAGGDGLESCVLLQSRGGRILAVLQDES